jgi:hypothetical protein
MTRFLKCKVSLLAAIAFLAASLSGAGAADLPAKAKPQMNIGYPLACGFYYGLEALGGGSTITNGPVGATQIQGAAGILAGYTCPFSGSFWFAEASFDIQNLNGSSNGFSIKGPLKFEQTVAVGADAILAVLGNLAPFGNLSGFALPSLPLLPSGVTAGPQHSYIHGTADEQDISSQYSPMLAVGSAWLFRGGGGIGMLSRLSNNAVIDVRATGFLQSSDFCLSHGAGCPALGAGFEVNTAVKF